MQIGLYCRVVTIAGGRKGEAGCSAWREHTGLAFDLRHRGTAAKASFGKAGGEGEFQPPCGTAVGGSVNWATHSSGVGRSFNFGLGILPFYDMYLP